LAERLSLDGFDVYGIDIAENIIEENKLRQTKVKYSIQDITTQTNFPNNFFDFIIFKFTLTNIHKEAWEKVSNEIFRLLKPNGRLLIIEPLVSESYQLRYDLASNFVQDKNCLYVFKDKDLAKNINFKEDLEQAIKNDQVSRIVKHYTVEEIEHIFNKLRIVDFRTLNIPSPSGYDINTFEGVFIKN
jgi:ubiquinone/menaquinone biosynthesis C-methylase UbiE